jgi:hypothetical protein
VPAAVALSSLFLFALAPLPIGLWQPGEPVMVGLLLIVAAAAVFVRRSLALWPLAAIVALTCATMPAQPFPMRSWLGTPELGIGGAWYAALGILAALMLGLDRVQLGRAVVAAGGVILAVVLISPGALRTLNDWTAFVGFAVAAEGSLIGFAVAAPTCSRNPVTDPGCSSRLSRALSP